MSLTELTFSSIVHVAELKSSINSPNRMPRIGNGTPAAIAQTTPPMRRDISNLVGFAAINRKK